MAEIGTATINVIPRFDPNIPRIQILELPMMHNGDYSATPFAVVIDGVSDEQGDSFAAVAEDIKDALGAKGVFIFRDRVAV